MLICTSYYKLFVGALTTLKRSNSDNDNATVFVFDVNLHEAFKRWRMLRAWGWIGEELRQLSTTWGLLRRTMITKTMEWKGES